MENMYLVKRVQVRDMSMAPGTDSSEMSGVPCYLLSPPQPLANIFSPHRLLPSNPSLSTTTISKIPPCTLPRNCGVL